MCVFYSSSQITCETGDNSRKLGNRGGQTRKKWFIYDLTCITYAHTHVFLIQSANIYLNYRQTTEQRTFLHEYTREFMKRFIRGPAHNFTPTFKPRILPKQLSHQTELYRCVDITHVFDGRQSYQAKTKIHERIRKKCHGEKLEKKLALAIGRDSRLATISHVYHHVPCICTTLTPMNHHYQWASKFARLPRNRSL